MLGPNGARVSVVTCVDDFMLKETRGNEKALTMRILGAFADRMGGWKNISHGDRPTTFKGYGIAWSRDNSVVSLHMTIHVEALAARWVPELLKGERPSDLLHGVKLTKALDALRLPEPRPAVLSSIAKDTQSIIGGLKYIERAVMLRISLHQQRLSSITSAPEGLISNTVARSVVALAYDNKYDSITYGGSGLGTRTLLQGGTFCPIDLNDPAPKELEIMADASTATPPIYAYAHTYNGAVLCHGVRRIHDVCVSSCHAEMRGSKEAADLGEVARNALTTMGRPMDGPTVLGTDNSAHLDITMGTANPQRVKPSLVHWASLKDRVRRQIVLLAKVLTDSMPVDFMTKWMKAEKVKAQIAYLTNSRHAVWPA